ncbi:mechanosensitive ion channel family protein [Thalassotalea sp. PS06]|uniref:mechanosensitive ion channel family protein n=1 Tax=Thalassotalea sp. PS06 TaxID=2594005 RepID=UPI00116539AA|nr:mechanosensitive ion channel family protein [Thalassotalea sp. PS06]QDP02781.1 mechanosensitive ion channel family protein [Thalassotalea sp. PS06]
MQQQWIETLKHYLSVVTDYPLLHASLMVLSFWIAAWIINKFFLAWVKRFTDSTEAKIDDRLVELLHTPVFYSIVIVGLIVATGVIDIPESVTNILFPAYYTLLLMLWTVFLIRFTRIGLRQIAKNDRYFHILHPQTLPLFENLALLVILGVSIYYILSSWHIDMTAWLASAGIIGIAVGFAAKDTLANLFSGVFIMADAPYKIHDYVVLETGERGEVTNIGLRSTRLLTRDNIEVTIPNSVMGNTKVINESGGPSTNYRIRAQVSVAYGSDVDQVREVLTEVAQDEPEINTFPEPIVRFRTFGPSGLEFEVMGWIEEPAFRGRILDQINTAIYKKFNELGIEIPYSKHDVYIKSFPNAALQRPETDDGQQAADDR